MPHAGASKPGLYWFIFADYDCVGYFGRQCALPNAEWRHRFRASWHTSFDTTISLGWRHIGSTQVVFASPDPDLTNPDLLESWRVAGGAVTEAYNYLDLAATYSFRDGLDLTFGINNLLDDDPPLMPSQPANDFRGMYDPLGRSIYSSLRFNF